jgi:outer membrane protein insertion porin family
MSTGKGFTLLLRFLPRFLHPGLLAAILLAVFPRASLAGGVRPRVLLIPFETKAERDIAGLRRGVMEALAASLSSRGADLVGEDEVREAILAQGEGALGPEAVMGLAERARAEFVVAGAVVEREGRLSLEAGATDAATGGRVYSYGKSAGDEAGLLRLADEAGAELHGAMDAALKARPAERAGTIDSVVISGNVRVDAEAVARKLKSRAGAEFSPDDARDDIRAIYSTGFFEDVVVDLSDTASGKVLTFIVKEKPFIKKVSIKGASELKEERVREALTVKERDVLDMAVLGENAERIKRLYAEEGFHTAEVRPVVEPDGVEAEVAFEIDEGPEAEVRRITVIGNSFFSEREIEGAMSTAETGVFSFLTGSGRFNEFAFEGDLAQIIGKYYDNGFVHAEVVDHRVLLSEDKRWFHITLALTEGGQYRFGAMDVRGDILTTRDELLGKFKFKEGDVFSRSLLSKGIEAVTDVYGDQGYAYADIRPATRVNEASKTVDVTLEIKKNELVYIERIDVSGNTRTRDKVIRREVEVAEGEIYSSSALKRSRNNLKRLGYFEDVRITQTRGSASGMMKLDVEVKERPTSSVSMAIGYSSVDHLIGTASFSQSNFMGTGVKLDVSGTVSSSSSKYVVSFTEPWLFDRPLSAGFDLYDTDKSYTDFDLNKQGFDVKFGIPIRDRYTRGYVTYKLEDVYISNVADDASTYIQEQEGLSTESSIKFSLKRDTRNDAFFPTDGYVVNLSTEFAGGPLGGTSYFLKHEAEAARFVELPLGTSFSIHGSIGHVHSYAGRDIPIYERYFLGGINSLRGFETRSVGPIDEASGDVIGGTTMVMLNNEFLFPIFSEQSMRGVIFFDIGNSYDGPIDLGDLREGAGIGLRWFSPIGPLRLELGFNLDRREGESAQQWEFAIGTSF